jgi:uncharacterized DUF497 family protein
VIYEWDAAKAKSNLQKHGVTSEAAAAVFLDPLALTFPDPDHLSRKQKAEGRRQRTVRYCTELSVWFSVSNFEFLVSNFSARKTTRGERKQYEEGISKGV